MQNYCKTIGALAAASALVAGNASAEVEYELHTGYTNQYIFRGIEFGDQLLEMGLDAATEYNGIGLSAGVWQADFDLIGTPNTSVQEIDLYGEASYDLGFATGAIGYIWYVNDAAIGDDAQEIYFSLGKELAYGIDAALTYYWDIETDNNGYAELGFEKGFELSSCLTLNLGTSFGYAAEEGELANIISGASLDWAVTESATISPFVSVAYGTSADSGYESDSNNEFVGGSMLSVSF